MIKCWRMILAGVLTVVTGPWAGLGQVPKDGEVALIFVGFGIPPETAPVNGSRAIAYIPEAVFIVTNKGFVPIELSWEVRPENRYTNGGISFLYPGFCHPLPRRGFSIGLPMVVKPGEEVKVFGSGWQPCPWTAEIGYRSLSASREMEPQPIRWAAAGPISANPYLGDQTMINRPYCVDFHAPSPPFMQIDFVFNPADAFDPVNLPKDWRPHITEPPSGLLNPATYRE